jgi:hypothetical protein
MQILWRDLMNESREYRPNRADLAPTASRRLIDDVTRKMFFPVIPGPPQAEPGIQRTIARHAGFRLRAPRTLE